MKKRDIRDILFWIAMLILTFWIIAKLLGLINTPEWINLIPLITITFLIGIFYQRVISSLDMLINRTNYLKKSLESLNLKVEKNTKTINSLKN